MVVQFRLQAVALACRLATVTWNVMFTQYPDLGVRVPVQE
jgi:hypothetical protein